MDQINNRPVLFGIKAWQQTFLRFYYSLLNLGVFHPLVSVIQDAGHLDL